MRLSRLAAPILLPLALVACGKDEAPAAPASATAPPAASAAAAQASAPAAPIQAPAGTYKLDPNHASLVAKVRHLGLADYHVRFTKFDVTLQLDPQNLAASSVNVKIDPTSVRTDYTGDYKATHKDSPYKTFEEAIARDAKFLQADQHGTIEFKSTGVEAKGDTLVVTGDLTFLGQTHPATLEAKVTGSMAKHPFTGVGAVGFTATGTLTRSQWGMTGTQQYLGDAVALQFDGEFQQEGAPKSEM